MRTKKFLFYLLAGILGGCVPVMSLHPLYTEQDVVFEEKLLGVWVDDSNRPDTTWEFRRPDTSKKEYELIFSDKEGNKGVFVARLVKLKDRLFLDVHPDQFPSGEKEAEKMKLPYNAFFFVSIHTFIKIDCIEFLPAAQNCLPEDEKTDKDLLKNLSLNYDYVLKLRLTDDDAFKKLLERDANAVKHEMVENNGVVLTASTKELQAFVLKYADDESLFTDAKVLLRRKTTSSQRPAKEDPNKAEVKQDPAASQKK
ncbi:MAG TPA: hypothetical protein VMW16_02095 [Sedimentisphaerales bacterium]|nr:hypothetical protein [Sedimentisphaerales bacterium]